MRIIAFAEKRRAIVSGKNQSRFSAMISDQKVTHDVARESSTECCPNLRGSSPPWHRNFRAGPCRRRQLANDDAALAVFADASEPMPDRSAETAGLCR
jgi:hypothetical protein